MIPLVLSPARWRYLPSPELALFRFHAEFAQEHAILPADFGQRVSEIHSGVPELLRELWLRCAAKEWLWQTSVLGLSVDLPQNCILRNVRLFGPDNPDINTLEGRRAATVVIPLDNRDGRPSTLRLWCFEKSGDLPSEQQHLLDGLDVLPLQPGDRIFCDDFPARLVGESWQLGAALAFRALREPERRHAAALGRHWIVTGHLDRNGSVLQVDAGNKLDLVACLPWTELRIWMWPRANKDALVHTFRPEQPAYFVETLDGAWARLKVMDDLPGRNADICRLLLSRGFRIAGTSETHSASRALDTLALLLTFDFPIFDGFLAAVRRGLGDGQADFVYDASRTGRVAELQRMCFLLKRNFVFDKYTIGADKVIRGRVSTRQSARHFLKGDWLERCVREIVQDFLNLQPGRIGCMQNICGERPDGITFELDTLLLIDDDLYWIESKSGGYEVQDIQRYADIRGLLGLPENRLSVVAGDLNGAGPASDIQQKYHVRILTPTQLLELVERLETQYLKANANMG